jgi:hypothetical protein
MSKAMFLNRATQLILMARTHTGYSMELPEDNILVTWDVRERRVNFMRLDNPDVVLGNILERASGFYLRCTQAWNDLDVKDESYQYVQSLLGKVIRTIQASTAEPSDYLTTFKNP